MKLSFSLPPKPSSSKQTTNLKPSHSFNTDDQDPSKPTKKEYVTEFDASRTLSQQQSNKLVIPPIPNEYRPTKKMKNLELPLQPSDRSDLRFEVEKSSPDVADGGPNISYGLNLRNSSSDLVDGKKNESVETVMLQKLKEDLNRLPADRGLDEYADMPVEGFGAALLAGYGWYEGRGIGRNPKGDVKVVQYEKRTAKEGLGFSSEIPPSSNNKKRGKEQRSRKGEEEKGLGLGFSSDMPTNNSNGNGNGKKRGQEQRSGIGEEEEGSGFSVGDVVRIVAGRDVGLKGRVVEVVNGGGFVVVKLLRSEEEVKVRIGDVAELGSVEEDRCLRKLKELKIRGGSKEEMVREDGRRDRRKDEKHRRGGRKSEKREEMTGTTTQVLKGGRLYLKKGEVVDMVGPTSCVISMDDSRELIEGVNQDILETVIPRRGGAVIVLYGKHKGAYGNLVERDMDNETGIVRDADNHEMLNVRLEQIAEYIGDPSYIGY